MRRARRCVPPRTCTGACADRRMREGRRLCRSPHAEELQADAAEAQAAVAGALAVAQRGAEELGAQCARLVSELQAVNGERVRLQHKLAELHQSAAPAAPAQTEHASLPTGTNRAGSAGSSAASTPRSQQPPQPFSSFEVTAGAADAAGKAGSPAPARYSVTRFGLWPHATPQELGMEDGDVLHVFVEQVGGASTCKA